MVGIISISTNDTTTTTATEATTTVATTNTKENNENVGNDNNENDTNNNMANISTASQARPATKEKVSGCTTDETCASTDISASSEVNVEMKDNTIANDDDVEDNRDLAGTEMPAEAEDDDAEDDGGEVNIDHQMIPTTYAPTAPATNSLKVIIPSDNIVISNNIPTQPPSHAMPALSAHQYTKKYTLKATTRSSKQQQPSTPLGQIVESGQEHTGRWTRDEHEAFLIALKKYGKEWKKVAAKVKTRTVVQTRTHAQKYFQKLQKQLNMKGATGNANTSTSVSSMDAAMMNLIQGSKEGDGSDDSYSYQDVTTTAKSKSTRRKRTSNNPPTIGDINTNSTLLGIQKGKIINNYITSPARITRSANSDTSDTYTSDTFKRRNSDLKIIDQPCPIAKAAAELMSKLATATVDIPNTTLVEPSQIPSIPPTETSLDTSMNEIEQEEPIRIYAPSQFRTRKDNTKKYFPEPSPAACGKRKLDELTAAQMLADVMMSSSTKTTSIEVPNDNIIIPGNEKDTFVVPFINQKEWTNEKPLPEKSDAVDTNTTDNTNSLSIINPDSLLEPDKKLKNESNPTTPWDGQLEELLKQNKEKEDIKEETIFKFHPIHNTPKNQLCKAISASSVEEVKSALSWANDVSIINQQDELGFTPLHIAACLDDHNLGADVTRLLLSHNINISNTIDTTIADICGNTALHWASYNGNNNILRLLLSRNCPLDKQNNDGETALHWAMRAGLKGIPAVSVLLEHGAKPFVFNVVNKRPIDVAASGFVFLNDNIHQSLPTPKNCLMLDHECKETEEIYQTRENFLSNSSQSRTLVLHHPECLEHKPKSNHDWEVPDRIIQILKRITPKEEEDEDLTKINFNNWDITISSDFDRASLEFLSRVHSTEYLAFVNDLSKELEKKRGECCNKEEDVKVNELCGNCSVVPFTPMVQRKVKKDIQIKQGNHSDTSFSVGSLRAARRAAGAVQHAVDCVLMGRNRNAFCIVRPPGHHAGYEGLLENGESCGFCIFNNVAAGAAHALSERHRPRVERCAIVDIDVHHGNGTEEIVQRFSDPSRLFFFSVHLYDRDCPKKGAPTIATSCSYTSCQKDDCLWKFYPGTGDTDDVTLNVINAPIAPLWKEKDLQDIFKKSSPTTTNNSPIHHNTRNRHKRKAAVISTAKVSSNDSMDVSSQISDSSTTDDHEKATQPQQPSSPTNTNDNQYLMGIGRKAYRRAIQHRLIPSLRAFNPDLILISAGFDAAGGDVGNAKHLASGNKRERAGMDLDPADYAWTTQKILEVADICCQGRVVSVLEGGYGHTPSAENTNQDVLLDKTIFTECAAQHLWAFVDPYNVEKRCG